MIIDEQCECNVNCKDIDIYVDVATRHALLLRSSSLKKKT